MLLRSALRAPARAVARLAAPALIPRNAAGPLGAVGRELDRLRARRVEPRIDHDRFPQGQPATEATDTVRVLRFLKGHRAQLEQTMGLLADEESRELLIRLLAYRALGGTHVHLPSDGDDPLASRPSVARHLVDETKREPFGTQLFEVGGLKLEAWPLNIWADFFERQYMFERGGVAVRAEPGDVVIDAGACFGDTSLMFAEAVGPGGQVHAFEPVPTQAEVVERNLALNPRLKERLVLHRLGLADRPGEARFSDAGAGAQQSATGGVLVRLTTIDRIVEEHGIAPSFIKMDIEGAESAALRGAAGTLRRHRPKLAISAYHSLDDLVGLAPLIHSLAPGYRFHLDHHTTHSEETVLYAIAS